MSGFRGLLSSLGFLLYYTVLCRQATGPAAGNMKTGHLDLGPFYLIAINLGLP